MGRITAAIPSGWWLFHPANPDPTKTVTWGDQTWEEMMIGWYSHVDPLKSPQGK
jgi:hypothetical protein